MPLVTLLTWVATLSIIVTLNLLIAIRFGYRAGLLPILFAFVPPMIFFPFAFDTQNILATGPYHFRHIVANLPKAWTIFGSTALVAMAAIFWSLNVSNRDPVVRLGFFGRSITKLVLDDNAALGLFIFQGILFIFLIASGFTYGAGTFSAFEDTTLRPVINLTSSVFSLSVALCLVRVMIRRSVSRWVVLLLTMFMAGLSGQRTVVLFPLIVFSLIFLSVRSIKFSIWPAIIALFLTPIAMAMADYRSTAVAITGQTAPVHSVQRNGLVSRFVYGNQFSDVRDLAWILSGYDGKLLLGKSYMAGYTPFIPSAYWDYRRKWGLGDWTVRRAGLDPRHHSGLRGGLFSELYFNFGFLVALVGAALVGLMIGVIIRQEVEHDRLIVDQARRAAFSLTSYIKVSLLLSTVFSPAFFGVPVIILLLLVVDTTIQMSPLRPRQLELA